MPRRSQLKLMYQPVSVGSLRKSGWRFLFNPFDFQLHSFEGRFGIADDCFGIVKRVEIVSDHRSPEKKQPPDQKDPQYGQCNILHLEAFHSVKLEVMLFREGAQN